MTSHIDTQDRSASPLEKLALSLQDETTGTQQKRADFEEAYPTLAQHLARKLPVKMILAKFNAAYGHALHPPAFRKLLEAERLRRADTGSVVHCVTCRQPWIMATDAVAPEGDMNDGEGEA